MILLLKIFSVFLLILFCCCESKNNTNKRITQQLKVEKRDTLFPLIKLSDSCYYLVKGFRNEFGYVISNYFDTKSFLSLDLNGDEINDTLVVLSPASLSLDNDGFYVCNNDNRILVEFLSEDNNVSKIGKIYYNVISNQVSRSWGGYETLEYNKKGFILKGKKGQGCIFEYSVYISKSDKIFYVDSINLNSKCPNFESKSILVDKLGKSMPLEKYKSTIIDSIKFKNDL